MEFEDVFAITPTTDNPLPTKVHPQHKILASIRPHWLCLNMNFPSPVKTRILRILSETPLGHFGTGEEGSLASRALRLYHQKLGFDIGVGGVLA